MAGVSCQQLPRRLNGFAIGGTLIQMPPGPARDLAVVNGGVMSEQLIHTKVEPPSTRRSRHGLRGQKPPLRVEEIWAIRIRLQSEERRNPQSPSEQWMPTIGDRCKRKPYAECRWLGR